MLSYSQPGPIDDARSVRYDDLHQPRRSCQVCPRAQDSPHAIAPLAQLDRASGYEPEGREFESLRAHHIFNHIQDWRLFKSANCPCFVRVLSKALSRLMSDRDFSPITIPLTTIRLIHALDCKSQECNRFVSPPCAAAIPSANSCIEWLAHEPPNLDRARAAATKIIKYGNRAAEIIDRIRSLSRKSPPQREPVDVNVFIHEMLTLLKGEAAGYSIAMRTELAASLPKIRVDLVQLQQVFMNLMLNAIEAMKESGGELTVRSQRQDSQLLLSVIDTGVGLPTVKMDQIFSVFFTTKPQGSGMGLAISRSIVESHGGRLWAIANDGRGATFHFTLPTEVMEPRLAVT